MPGVWRIDDDRLLVELLRLMLRNVGPTLFSTLPLLAIIVWALSNESNALNLQLWAGAVMAWRLVIILHARHVLAAELSGAALRRQVKLLILLNAVDGMVWGALAWVGLDASTLIGNIVVMAVLAGVANSAMAVLAVIPPVFFAFCLFDIGALALKLWLMADPAYAALAGIGALYIAVLVAQAHNNARATQAAIRLRFENLDLVERLRVETDNARAAHREAELANQAKTRFLAAASHDLRQPIHAQGLFLDVLSRTPLAGEQEELLASTRAAWRATSDMLDTLLDFSRIEAGVLRPSSQPFHLQTVLHRIENELAPLADAKGLVYRSRETTLTAHSDARLVEMVLRNLVSNAIRYTAHGGMLVACRRHGPYVSVEVWDTGIGIEATDRQAIFSEFHQLGNPERDREKGLGLGLAIAAKLAAALGHDLSMDSRPGRGSVFRLVLPLTTAAAAEEPPASLARRLPHRRVLVIEDDRVVASAMAQLLQSWGCACDLAGSVEEALSAARLRRPDIVISDYRLREQRTGAQAIAELRGLLGRRTPALLITGDTAPERLREALASGIPLLHKPVRPELLHQAMAEALE